MSEQQTNEQKSDKVKGFETDFNRVLNKFVSIIVINMDPLDNMPLSYKGVILSIDRDFLVFDSRETKELLYINMKHVVAIAG